MLKILNAISGLIIAAVTTLLNAALWPITIPLAILSSINLRNALKGNNK